MNKRDTNVLTSEKPILGFRPAELLGIMIMLIPFAISCLWNTDIETQSKYLFITTEIEKPINMYPNLITALFAVSFYAALIFRFGIFRADSFIKGIISSIQLFLDCWVLAALLSLIIPTNVESIKTIKAFSIEIFKSTQTGIFKDNQFIILIFAVLFTWLGMKTIAGYSWIAFIVIASTHVIDINNAMEKYGAILVITTAISLFFQIKDLADAKDFLLEFRGGVRNYTAQVKSAINEAAYDAERKAYVVSDFVRRSTPLAAVVTPDFPRPEPASTVKNIPAKERVTINLEALDLNNDGVVDEKDLLLMSQMTQKKEQDQ